MLRFCPPKRVLSAPVALKPWGSSASSLEYRYASPGHYQGKVDLSLLDVYQGYGPLPSLTSVNSFSPFQVYPLSEHPTRSEGFAYWGLPIELTTADGWTGGSISREKFMLPYDTCRMIQSNKTGRR